jgi:nitrogen fixation protein FixH
MKRKLSGRDVFLLLTAFFVVIFAVNGIFIAQAVMTFRGEDQQDPYLQGIDFNRTLEREALQKSIGWRASIEGTRTNRGSAEIVVTLKDSRLEPVRHLLLQGMLRHPSDQHRDRAFTLSEISPGAYASRLNGIAAGAWDVVVLTPSKLTPPFEAERRLWLR